MFTSNFRKTGWLKRYLIFRVSTPFAIPYSYLDQVGEGLKEHNFDELLYTEVKEKGMLFGCPVISQNVKKLADKLNFPKQQGGSILLYLETLFSVALFENECLTSKKHDRNPIPYEIRLLEIILLALRYHIPDIYYRIPDDITPIKLLAENETLSSALKQFEEELLDSVTLSGYSSMGNRQNNFAFSKLYFFLLWLREKHTKEKCDLETFLTKEKLLREEMITIFAALIWADNYMDSTEQNVIKKYIKQTRLSESKQTELKQRILKPVKIEEIQCSTNSVIVRNYLVGQLILLSLINNQEAWQERELIENVSNKLNLTAEKLEELYFTVAEFFTVHNQCLEFLKNNAAVRQFQDYMNDKIVKLVKKNVDKIMTEIEETKELSELLLKAATKQLTAEEKQKVQDQLIDVAKSIPALTIFALPGGGLLLPILIKVLPFNILPSSFQDEPVLLQ